MIYQAISNFFLRPSDGRMLAVLRLVIGFAVFSEALLVLPHIDGLYGQQGYLQSHLMEAIAGPTLPSWSARLGIDSVNFAHILKAIFTLHIIFSAAFTLGYKTRKMNVALLVTQMAIVNSGWGSSYGIDRYLHCLLFITMWFPSGDHYSLDAKTKQSRPHNGSSYTLGCRLIQIFMLLSYVNAGMAKAMGTDWWTGSAVWEALHIPEFNRFDLTWLASYPWILKGLCLGTLFIETFYAIGFWLPRVGTFWVYMIISMHLAIAIVMDLTLFGLTMALINYAVFLVPLNRTKEAYEFKFSS